MPTLQSFTSFDWFLLVLVAISTFAALRRGIIRVLFSLAGLILSILLASYNYPSLAERLHHLIPSFAVAQIVAFLLILVVVMALATLSARIVRKAVSTVGLGFFDRLLGAVFGLARGLLFGVAVMMGLAAFTPGSPWLQGSQLAPYFLSGAHAVSLVVPEHFGQKISNGASFLLQKTPELFPHPTSKPM